MILSIDPGVHNLALCIMEASNIKDFKTYKIHLLETHDILESTDKKCNTIQKNKKICEKKCKYKYKNDSEWIYTCKLHAPKKQTLKDYKRKTINLYKLQDLVKIMIEKIEDIYKQNEEIFHMLKKVHIELQPSKNPKSKLLSHMIYGKLIDLLVIKANLPVEIKFISAKHKLNIKYNGPPIVCKLKSAYSKRKYLSVEICKWYITTQFCQEQKEKWFEIMLKGKSDDKCDTICYCIYAIQK